MSLRLTYSSPRQLTHHEQLFIRFIALIFLALLLPSTLRAHAPSDTYLYFHLTATNVTGHWEIKLRDLQHALGFDNLGAMTPQQLRERQEGLALDALSGLRLKLDDKPAPIQITDEQIVTRRDGEALLLN